MSDQIVPMTDDSLGTLVRSHREGRRLKQKELAQACGLSPVYISQIENGERIPSAQACRSLAAALGCSPRLLVLRAYRAAAPEEIEDLFRDREALTSGEPLFEELAPLLAAVQALPPATRTQVLRLWQETLALVRGSSAAAAEAAAVPPSSSEPPKPPASAEAYAETPYY